MSDITVAVQAPRNVQVQIAQPQIVVAMGGQQGPAGSSAASFVHSQPTAAALWVINHNLGRRVDVELQTVGGVTMLGDVIRISDNQVQVSFAADTAGFAFIH